MKCLVGKNKELLVLELIVTNPKLILADEPTGALDSKSSKSVIRKIK